MRSVISSLLIESRLNAERADEVDAAEYDALDAVRLGRQRGDGVAVVVARRRSPC